MPSWLDSLYPNQQPGLQPVPAPGAPPGYFDRLRGQPMPGPGAPLPNQPVPPPPGQGPGQSALADAYQGQLPGNTAGAPQIQAGYPADARPPAFAGANATAASGFEPYQPSVQSGGAQIPYRYGQMPDNPPPQPFFGANAGASAQAPPTVNAPLPPVRPPGLGVAQPAAPAAAAAPGTVTAPMPPRRPADLGVVNAPMPPRRPAGLGVNNPAPANTDVDVAAAGLGTPPGFPAMPTTPPRPDLSALPAGRSGLGIITENILNSLPEGSIAAAARDAIRGAPAAAPKPGVYEPNPASIYKPGGQAGTGPLPAAAAPRPQQGAKPAALPPARPAATGPYQPPESSAFARDFGPGRGQMWGPQGGVMASGAGGITPAYQGGPTPQGVTPEAIAAATRAFQPGAAATPAQGAAAPPAGAQPAAYNTGLWRNLIGGGVGRSRVQTPRLLGMNQGGGRG